MQLPAFADVGWINKGMTTISPFTFSGTSRQGMRRKAPPGSGWPRPAGSHLHHRDGGKRSSPYIQQRDGGVAVYLAAPAEIPHMHRRISCVEVIIARTG